MRFYGLCAVACDVLLAAVSCKEKTVDGTGGTERQEGIHYVKSVKSVCELFGAVSESKAVFRYDDAWRLSRIDVTDEDGSYAVGYAWERDKAHGNYRLRRWRRASGVPSRWTVPVG